MDPKQLLEQAVSHHQQGRLKQAETLYQRAFYAGVDEARAFHLYGLLLVQSGHPDRAVRQIKRAIGREPEHGPYHADLGNALTTVGRYEEAQAAYEHSLRCGADRPSVLANMGLLMTRRGRLDQAVALLEEATGLAPDSAPAWQQLGQAHRLRQEPVRAESCLRTALEIDNTSADLHNDLGLVLAAQQRYEEAAKSFRTAIAQQSDHAAAWCNLGNALKKRGKLDEAVGAYRAAIRARKGFPEARDNLGNVLTLKGEWDEAISVYRHTIADNPRDTRAHHHLGRALEEHGRSADAIVCYRQALALNPRAGSTWLDLAHARRTSSRDAEVATMEGLCKDGTIPAEQRMYLAFALGKVCDDLGEYEQASEFLEQANALKRQSIADFGEENAGFFSAMMSTVDRKFISARSDWGRDDETPLFIVGMPRSGTSLVEQILASHPQVHGAGELDFLRDFLTLACSSNSLAQIPKRLATLDRAEFLTIADRYLDALRGVAPQGAHVSDKNPLNFRFIGVIRILFPAARIIHCRRNAMATCTSIYRHHFSGHHPYAYHPTELGQYYRQYLQLMDHWRETAAEKLLDFDYEALVANQKTQTRQLLDFCGLEWDERCLRFYENKRPVGTASTTQVRQPIYDDAIEAWRRYEKALAPLVHALAEK